MTSLSLESISLKNTTDELLEKLYTCETSFECLNIAEELGRHIQSKGLLLLQTENVLFKLMVAANNRKSGLEREGGLIGLYGIANILGKCALPYLMPLIPDIMDLQADKGLAVREAAKLANSRILELINGNDVHICVPYILDSLKGKWQSKIEALNIVCELSTSYPNEIGYCLPEIIPAVTNCMHDTKLEV